VKRAERRRQGLGAIELIEQAIHQLRAAPPATLACYYLGALPFVLGLLFFWADMSRSAFAEQHLTGAALGLAALFFWMKFWQAVFARHLRAAFAGEPPPPLGLRQSGRIFLAQTALQPSGLFLLPLALIVAVPWAWVCAFYQNLTAFGAAETGALRPVLKRAARQAALWPKQNHTLLAILLGFGFYVFLNWATVCLVLPYLAKTLLGVDSVFTRSPSSLLNTTFLAAMLGLTYLSVDPIVKTVYALRCFYGESLESGEDLKAELRRLALAERPVVAGVLVAMLVCGAALSSIVSRTWIPSPPLEERARERRSSFSAHTPDQLVRQPAGMESRTTASSMGLLSPTLSSKGGEGEPPARCLRPSHACTVGSPLAHCRRKVPAAHTNYTGGPATTPTATPNPAASVSPASVSAPELDRAIGKVIQQNKYAWRMPREKIQGSDDAQPGIIVRFFQRVGDFLRRGIKAFFEWLAKWLNKLFPHQREGGASGYSWIMLLEVLLYVLVAAVVAGLAILLLRLWRNRKHQKGPIASQPIQPVPDLTDESLGAEQLPEDRWLTLARELLERSELRLAVRAFYFASLAHLAEHNLISLAKFKSNRDYERELRRRGHSFPALLALFDENVRVIDRTWYGRHQVNAELVSQFAANVERIKLGA